MLSHEIIKKKITNDNNALLVKIKQIYLVNIVGIIKITTIWKYKYQQPNTLGEDPVSSGLSQTKKLLYNI